MLIVSQDKETIFNLEQIPTIQVNENSGGSLDSYFLTIYPLGINLGYYKTKERAKEVFQEIIYKYQEVHTNINVSMVEVMYNYNEPKVYEMPEQ